MGNLQRVTATEKGKLCMDMSTLSMRVVRFYGRPCQSGLRVLEVQRSLHIKKLFCIFRKRT
jgi:hypothetical protein